MSDNDELIQWLKYAKAFGIRVGQKIQFSNRAIKKVSSGEPSPIRWKGSSGFISLYSPPSERDFRRVPGSIYRKMIYFRENSIFTLGINLSSKNLTGSAHSLTLYTTKGKLDFVAGYFNQYLWDLFNGWCNWINCKSDEIKLNFN